MKTDLKELFDFMGKGNSVFMYNHKRDNAKAIFSLNTINLLDQSGYIKTYLN